LDGGRGKTLRLTRELGVSRALPRRLRDLTAQTTHGRQQVGEKPEVEKVAKKKTRGKNYLADPERGVTVQKHLDQRREAKLLTENQVGLGGKKNAAAVNLAQRAGRVRGGQACIFSGESGRGKGQRKLGEKERN